ncbi:hypothetical protein GCM10025883_37610 [Mobilicoccus caccae]|uniref:Secreted protein n=1 Tax=Mobilicoccus caccae TaxID=1859295 RepID=A0ABQ6IXC0_9MICO|nr:hypothetical protein GCM10025883_37610 [Mobilicoccus caccae]
MPIKFSATWTSTKLTVEIASTAAMFTPLVALITDTAMATPRATKSLLRLKKESVDMRTLHPITVMCGTLTACFTWT